MGDATLPFRPRGLGDKQSRLLRPRHAPSDGADQRAAPGRPAAALLTGPDSGLAAGSERTTPSRCREAHRRIGFRLDCSTSGRGIAASGSPFPRRAGRNGKPTAFTKDRKGVGAAVPETCGPPKV